MGFREIEEKLQLKGYEKPISSNPFGTLECGDSCIATDLNVLYYNYSYNSHFLKRALDKCQPAKSLLSEAK